MVTRLQADTSATLALLRRLIDDPDATDYWRREVEEMARRLTEGAFMEERIRAALPPALNGAIT